MKVSIKLNNSALSKLSKAQAQALEMTGQQVLNDLRNAQTVPFDTGNLQNDQTYVDTENSSNGNVGIVSDTPYARRLYFHPEINFQKGKNPNAGAAWFDPYLSGEKKKLIKSWFKQFIQRTGGGYVK